MNRTLAALIGLGILGFAGETLAGKPVALEGTLEILISDNFKESKSEKIAFLRGDRSAIRLELKEAHLASLKSGMRVRARGDLSGGTLVATELQALTTEPTATIATSWGTGTQAVSVAGPQRVLVMNLRFLRDGALSDTSYSNSELNGAVFGGAGSVNAFYQKSSFGIISVVGEVAGPLTVDVSGTTGCDLGNWMMRSDDAARAAGIDPTGFQHKVYMLPSGTQCPYGVAGYGGGGVALIFAPWGTHQTIVGHELGHSMGLGHARTVSGDEYGDNSCIMARPDPASMNNAPHKIFMGWIPQERVQTIGVSGVYPVTTSDLDLAATQALRIPVPGSTADEAYYVSYRVSQGFQSRDYAKFFGKKISIHLCKWNSCSTSNLAALLGVGGVFSDPAGLLHFKVESVGSSEALVRIFLGADTQAPTAPSGVSASASLKGSAVIPMVTVSWSPSSDNFGVAKYLIYLKGPSGTISGPFESFQTPYSNRIRLERGLTEIWVIAVDGSGNQSAPSGSYFLSY
ncbi:MAG: hypothetical protein NDJ89_09455 [Oligoflexia bacterium]|nr:hypothetical protein [Oligoflexia bacterium]